MTALTPKRMAISAGVFALVAFAIWWRLANDPLEIDLANRFASPSLATPLGTDELGRDMLSRLISGALITIGAAVAAPVSYTHLTLPTTPYV